MRNQLRHYVPRPRQILAVAPALMYAVSFFLPALELHFDMLKR
jgi:hypothetical protein